MLALSLAPCDDTGNGIVDRINHFLGIEHEHVIDHEKHSNTCGDDDCSPFCFCNCCSTTLDSPEKVTFISQYSPPISRTYSSFVPSLILSPYTSSVWQPPKAV